MNFNDKVRPRSKADKKKNINIYESANALYEVRGLTLNVFKSGIFPLKTTQRKGLQILPPKQMLQRLPISLPQVQAGKENLVNEICQIIYYLYWAKEISKKIYNNIINSIKVYKYKMDTIFMNFENSKTSEPHRLLRNVADKINLKRSDKWW